MEKPSHSALEIARDFSDAVRELHDFKDSTYEDTPLHIGERVHWLSLEGEFTGTVIRNWPDTDKPNTEDVWVVLDVLPDHRLHLHRSMFRKFGILDHLSDL